MFFLSSVLASQQNLKTVDYIAVSQVEFPTLGAEGAAGEGRPAWIKPPTPNLLLHLPTVSCNLFPGSILPGVGSNTPQFPRIFTTLDIPFGGRVVFILFVTSVKSLQGKIERHAREVE